METVALNQALPLARAALDGGNPGRAIDIFAAFLERHRGHPEALVGLAEGLFAVGRKDEALRYALAGTQSDPTVRHLRALAQICHGMGLGFEAVVYLTAAMTKAPEIRADAMDDARAILDQALAEYQKRFGRTAQQALDALYSRIGGDIQRLSISVDGMLDGKDQIRANVAAAINRTALSNIGQEPRYAEAYYAALLLAPGYWPSLINIGDAMIKWRNDDRARHLVQAATIVAGDSYASWAQMAAVFDVLKHHFETEVAARKSLSLHPEQAITLNNLGNSLKDQGRLAEAVEAYRKAVSLSADPRIFANYVFSLTYAPGFTADEVADIHRSFEQTYALPFKAEWGGYQNDRTPGRRLRIGFVSPDLKNHAVSYFVEPLWDGLDREAFEIHAYMNMTPEDQVSARLKSKCANWRNVAALTDEQLAQRIREDRIDILVDLAGHTARNRLLVFARKPAPVQVTWLGHPNTTGLTAIDWRLTDGLADPPGVEHRYSEKLWRLPDVFCCYAPLVRDPALRHDPSYAVRPPPATRNGYITFGCCNNLAKIGPEVVELWSRILREVPDSKLLIEAPGLHVSHFRRELETRFQKHGIGPERLVLLARDGNLQYLRYHDVDIALDPFPCTGGTTTCDLLWMGVPLVSLVGDGFVSRMGLTLVNAVGHPEWAVTSKEEYLTVAKRLAADIPGLVRLRSELRQNAEAGPLGDHRRFGAAVGAAFRRMWTDWCDAPDAGTEPTVLRLVECVAANAPAATQARLAEAVARTIGPEDADFAEALNGIGKNTTAQPFEQIVRTLWKKPNPERVLLAAALLMLPRHCLEAQALVAHAIKTYGDEAPPVAEQLKRRAAELIASVYRDSYGSQIETDQRKPFGVFATHPQLSKVKRRPGATAAQMLVALRAGRDQEAVQIGLSLLQGVWQPSVLTNLAVAMRRLRAYDLAERLYILSASLQPGQPDPLVNLGNLLCDVGRPSAALGPLYAVTLIEPGMANGWGNLAVAFNLCRKSPAEAEMLARRSLALAANDGNVLNALGTAVKAQGRVEEAVAIYKRLTEVKPGWDTPFHNYLLALQYAQGYTPDEVAREHRRFGEVFERSLKSAWGKYRNDRSPDRRLRVGFVSPDLRNHSVAYFVEPLWMGLDPVAVEIVGYMCTAAEDQVSARLKALCGLWRNVAGLDDEALAKQVREDRIDILIDLAGHTGRNRLLTFARKPAPVQATWLGHPNTTGLTAIDWRFTDIVADPDGVESRYAEKLWRLPDVFCCYLPGVKDPTVRTAPEYAVRPPPALRNGFITFGCCNNLAKITPQVVALWSRLLARVPTARLLIEAPGLKEEGFQEELVARFAKHGVTADRLILVERDTTRQYLTYHDIDIALDPFPANGGTTTCDVLWMGLPLVSLCGDAFVTRMGASLVAAIGRPEWAVDSEDAYVELAVRLASDPAALAAERATQRQRVEASPLMDQKRFGAAFAAGLRAMWTSYLESGK